MIEPENAHEKDWSAWLKPGRSVFVPIVLFSQFAACGALAAIADYPVPNETVCAPFRQGPLTSEVLDVYRTREASDAGTPEKLRIYYRPEYIAFPDSPPDPPSVKPTTAVFIFDSVDGQPIPPDKRYGVRPSKDTHVSIVVSSKPYLELQRKLAIHANLPIVGLGGGKWTTSPAPYRRLGKGLAGYEKVEVFGANIEKARIGREDVHVEEDQQQQLVGVLICDTPGSVPNPSCELFEETPDLEVEVGQFRRNEAGRLTEIKTIARAFVACLTWEGK